MVAYSEDEEHVDEKGDGQQSPSPRWDVNAEGLAVAASHGLETSGGVATSPLDEVGRKARHGGPGGKECTDRKEQKRVE